MEVLSQSNIQEADSLEAFGGSFATEWFIRTKEVSNITIDAFHLRAGRVSQQVPADKKLK